MKRLLLHLLLSLGICIPVHASHITGGEMSYTYRGANRYDFTLKLYMRCNSGRVFNDPAIVGVFDKRTGARLFNQDIPLTAPYTISLDHPDQCISNPPFVCYEVGTYQFTLTLPPNADGYIVSSEVNYRIAGISNLQPGSSQIGATYAAEVPGSSSGVPEAYRNNSAHFTGSDLVIVCANNHFQYSFAAEDEDGDELRYSFCYAYQASNIGGNANPPLNPPYPSVPYGQGYSASQPLGSEVRIDPLTGLISGIAPPEGIYVVTVCVQEIRNGHVIATQRKDLQIHIAACGIASASLDPFYSVCRDSYSIVLENLSVDPMITVFEWNVYNHGGSLLYNSTQPQLHFTFPDTGKYLVSLRIATASGCSDTTATEVRVYPGFVPAFTAEGFCFPKVTSFRDASTSVYGVPNQWNWDFGESASSIDASSQQHPSYAYPTLGVKNVLLTVGNSVGCLDTVSRNITIFDKPPINLAFRDSLICINDRVQLHATGNGQFSWTPNAAISNASTPDPTVFPAATTWYVAKLELDGCINRDSVRIRVVDHVDLTVMNDSTICSGDLVTLRASSNGFLFSWTPAALLNDPTMLSPVATPFNTTSFAVTARLGGCTATKQVKITTVPYPQVFAGEDSTICFGTDAFLHGQTNGSSFAWSPAAALVSPNALSTVVHSVNSGTYVLSAYDTKGCPKPGRDTVEITVLPRIRAFAGNDTAVVINQPLQLNGSGGSAYQWEPPIGLSNTHIAAPVALYTEANDEGIRYKLIVSNHAGCTDSAYLTVKVFATGPTIFVPSAFTPNNDGLNDVMRPIAAGMQRLDYFSVFNRSGQLVFRTSEFGKGWNGKLDGHPQDPAAYVWMISAQDYLGRPYVAKGSFLLIR